MEEKLKKKMFDLLNIQSKEYSVQQFSVKSRGIPLQRIFLWLNITSGQADYDASYIPWYPHKILQIPAYFAFNL